MNRWNRGRSALGWSSRLAIAACCVWLLAGCGRGPSDDVSSGSPTPLSQPSSRGKRSQTTSPLLPGVTAPAALSTTAGIVVAGGSTPAAPPNGTPRISSTAVLVGRDGTSTTNLPALPPGDLIEFGVAIADVPYLLGVHCSSVEPVDRSSSCRKNVVLRLEDDGQRWAEVEGAADALANAEIGAVGVTEGKLLVVPAGSKTTAFQVFDPRSGRWSAVGGPDQEHTNLLEYCFGADAVIAYYSLDGPERTAPMSAQPFQYLAWGYKDGTWTDSSRVDLGQISPTKANYRSELCGSRGLMFNNGATGAGISISSSPVLKIERIDEVPPYFKATQGVPNTVGVTSDGDLLLQDQTDWLHQITTEPSLPATGPVRSTRTKGWIDLLEITEGGDLVVTSVPDAA